MDVVFEDIEGGSSTKSLIPSSSSLSSSMTTLFFDEDDDDDVRKGVDSATFLLPLSLLLSRSSSLELFDDVVETVETASSSRPTFSTPFLLPPPPPPTHVDPMTAVLASDDLSKSVIDGPPPPSPPPPPLDRGKRGKFKVCPCVEDDEEEGMPKK